ncbi:MAG: hypothetical protein IT422_19955 [Pirellulaceae bacterium]|jgi:hypothetical protein|nr:hypothetical protein [Pirellulaceae bacterium]
MQPSSDDFRLSSAILSRLDELRRLLRRYVTAQGLLLIALWLLIAFWLGGLIDYLPVTVGSSESPRALRIGLLIVMLAGSLWIAWKWIVVRLWVRLENKSLALLLERSYPQLNNELITAVELSGQSSSDVANPTAYSAMLVRVHDSATQHIADVKPRELFNWQPLWTVGLATTFAVVVTVVAAVGMSDWTGRWSRRLFALTDEPWPRRAALRADGLQLQIPAFSTQLSAERVWLPFVDGVVRVPQGAAPLLQISADAGAPQVPEICTLYYRASDGARGRANLRRVGGPRDAWQPFTLDGPPLDGLSQNMHIDIVGLDARLRDLTIEVVEPAVIADMQLACEYPSYLLDSLSVRAQQETLEYRTGIFIPEGTDVTLRGTASGPLSRVDYLLHGATDQQGSEIQDEVRSLDCSDATFEIPLGKVAHSQVIEVRLLDQFGLSAEQIPRYVIAVREDTIPEVTAQLDGIGLAITPNAMLPIVGSVTDDHGVQTITADLAVNESEPLSLPLELEETKLQATIDLEQLVQQGTTQLAPGATLGIVVSASDYYDLKPQPHVGRGQPVQLSVVTPDQLLVILDRQELELRQRLEQIVAELEQLREVLQTLKNELPPTALRTRPADSARGMIALQQEAMRESRAEQVQRLSGLWAQQSILQADKSQQELSSVAARVDNLRQQLVNNRIDSYDRQERLLSKVGVPLRELLAAEYPVLQRNLADLQSATLAGGGSQAAAESSRALDAVLLKLDAIKSNMQDIEDFNEIIDLVRGLLDDQEKVLSETEQEQRKRILELLR